MDKFDFVKEYVGGADSTQITYGRFNKELGYEKSTAKEQQ